MAEIDGASSPDTRRLLPGLRPNLSCSPEYVPNGHRLGDESLRSKPDSGQDQGQAGHGKPGSAHRRIERRLALDVAQGPQSVTHQEPDLLHHVVPAVIDDGDVSGREPGVAA